MNTMRKLLVGLSASVIALTLSNSALAQSGHFVGTVSCTDIGTQVSCTGKVAGLGGTTFQILVTAQGSAIVECTNPGGNVAPGQTTNITTLGDSGPRPTPRNGQHVFSVVTSAPSAPAGSCPNSQWVGSVVDVVFTTATVQLFEDGVLTDTTTVTVQ